MLAAFTPIRLRCRFQNVNGIERASDEPTVSAGSNTEIKNQRENLRALGRRRGMTHRKVVILF